MTTLYLNLAVRDVRAAEAFWSAVGFEGNPAFRDDHTGNVVIDERLVVMLLDHSRFADFVTGPVADPMAGTAALYCLSAESRDAVDALTDRALGAGAGAWLPAQDHGFVYGRSFQDPDGHVWEVMWMDPASTPGG